MYKENTELNFFMLNVLVQNIINIDQMHFYMFFT